MEEKEIRLIWRGKARQAFVKIHSYIAGDNPQNADEFMGRMVLFIKGLTFMPNKYAPCRFKEFADKNYHCAVFEKHYIIFYKFTKKTVYIQNIIRTSRLR